MRGLKNEKIIGEFPRKVKGRDVEDVVQVRTYNIEAFGSYVDIRVWVRRSGMSEATPTQKGVAIQKERFPDLMKLLEKIK